MGVRVPRREDIRVLYRRGPKTYRTPTPKVAPGKFPLRPRESYSNI